MNKVRNLFLALAIVGLLVSVSITKVQAGCSGPMNECVDCCKRLACDAGQFKMDCSGLTGEDKRDCTTLRNVMAKCCYSDCLEGSCGIDAGDSIVCEALEELCAPI